MGLFRAVSICKFKEVQVHTLISRSYVIWHSKSDNRPKRYIDNINDFPRTIDYYEKLDSEYIKSFLSTSNRVLKIRYSFNTQRIPDMILD